MFRGFNGLNELQGPVVSSLTFEVEEVLEYARDLDALTITTPRDKVALIEAREHINQALGDL